MRKGITISLIVVGAVVVVLLAGALYIYFGLPAKAPPSDIQVDRSPERVTRGQYLFEDLCDCASCHSEHDFTLAGLPVLEARKGAGYVMPDTFGLPGTVVAPNITPDPETGIGDWTDGEIIRAVREGVDRDGKALFPMMPYQSYASMSDNDIEALVAYLWTLPPIRNQLPRTELDFPLPIIIKTMPKPVGSVPEPDHSDPVTYGEYLVTVGGCEGCHTPEENGQPVMDRRLAGGREFQFPEGMMISANITPDDTAGIGLWSEDRFVTEIRTRIQLPLEPVTQQTFTLMPWTHLAQLTDDDLRAIYRYLRTVPPIGDPVGMVGE